jgi:hypothetical protein
MQQALLRYYGNATGCIGHATKETQHVTICNVYNRGFQTFTAHAPPLKMFHELLNPLHPNKFK